MKENAIKNKSFAFAIRIVNLYKYLVEEKKEFVLSKQLLRSGTAIGALTREAEHAESKADFIHKFKIADKEIKETEYWLLLCKKAEKYPSPNDDIFNQLKSIENITSKIIITSKKYNK